MGLPRWIGRTLAVARISLEGLPFRLKSFWTAIVGFAATTAVLAAVLSIQKGFEHAMTAGGRSDLAIVTSVGAATEIQSALMIDDVRTLDEVRRNLDAQTVSVATAEVLTTTSLPSDDAGLPSNVAFRGVQPESFAVYKNVKVTQGRSYQSGLNEIIVGAALTSRFGELALGHSIRLGRTDWTVVGVFESGGDLHQSEIWTDAETLQSSFERANVFQSVRMSLPSEEFFAALQRAVDDDPRLNLNVQREADYLAEQSKPMSRFIGVIGSIIAALMGIGAVFGIVNTMHTVIAERASEFSILRVIGFGRMAILGSVIIEGAILGVLGGMIGAAVAFLTVNGLEAGTLMRGGTSQLFFAFSVTPNVMRTSIVYALALGLIGSVLPAIQTVRQPIVVGLRR